MDIYETALKKIKTIIKMNKKNTIQHVVDYLQKSFDTYTWVGIYVVKNNILHLGPWQGPHATDHTRIPVGKGICGAAAETGNIENITDVHDDNRYLSCFVSTRSEIVVPIRFKDNIIGEIDIDSDTPHAFTQKDEQFLKKIADMLAEHIHNT
jgi:GAF domain-containing protein